MELKWKEIEELQPRIFADYLSRQYPQTVAAVLSHLEDDYSAKILESFTVPFALEVIMRIKRIEPVHKSILEIVVDTIYEELIIGRKDVIVTPPDKFERIFNKMSQVARERFAENVRYVNVTADVRKFAGVNDG